MIYDIESKDFILQSIDTSSQIGAFGMIKHNKAKLNILLIKAKWCGHCQTYLPKYKNISSMPKVNFFVLETTNDLNALMLKQWEQFMAPAYKIRGFPTVIMYDEDGKIIKIVERENLEREIKQRL